MTVKGIITTILSIFLTTIAAQTYAQVAAPDLRCIEVSVDQFGNRNITLTWIPPNDPNNQFINYHIIRNNGAGWSTLTTNLPNRLQNIYIDNSSPNARAKYYLVTEYNDGSTKISAPSDTLEAMELQLTLTAPNQSGTLNWNSMRNTPLPTWNSNYNLKRKVVEITTPPTNGTWQDRFAEPVYGIETYLDNIVRCSSEVAYRIEIQDASGCISKSNEVVDDIIDNDGAARMTFTQITIDRKKGGIVLNWDKHPDGSVVSYNLIYIDANGVPKFIGVIGKDTLTFRDTIRDPTTGTPLCYQISANDSCSKTQGSDGMHCTMFLSDTSNACEGHIYLKWTPYVGWNEVDSYYIYARNNLDTTYRLVGSTDGNDSDFVVENLNTLLFYTFYIEARDGTGKYYSHSNLRGSSFNRLGSIDFLYLRSVDVTSPSSVGLRVLLDRKVDINYLNIYRSVQRSGPYKIVGRARPPASQRDTLFTITDSTAQPGQINYVYKVEAIDKCDKPIRQSNMFRTTHLKGKSFKEDMYNRLEWTANIFEDPTAEELDFYSLSRKIGVGNYEIIRSKNANELFHEDDLNELIHVGGSFCYQLSLMQAASDTFEVADTSRSNEVCFKMEPDVFVPNSFTPNLDGINELWRPKSSFTIPYSSYLLQVYDRWGRKVFETDDPSAGWDGTFNGNNSAEGSYSFRLEIISAQGSAFTESGSFSLVR